MNTTGDLSYTAYVRDSAVNCPISIHVGWELLKDEQIFKEQAQG